MKKPDAASVVDEARDYYDSRDADNFYFRIWGGEDIHIGWYETEDETIFDASRRTVERMAARLAHRGAGTRVLDIGAGYGGSARWLAAERAYTVTCLNLSTVQNARNRRVNRKQGLDRLIDVVDGRFEDLPFADGSHDVVWSQDALLHSGDRERVFREVDRVLRPGGAFVFTDPMQRTTIDPELLQPVLDRIHLASLGSVAAYKGYADALGWATVAIEDATDKLVRHYTRVLSELRAREAELAEHCSRAYIERMKVGLGHWIRAGERDALAWGILHFRKPGEGGRS